MNFGLIVCIITIIALATLLALFNYWDKKQEKGEDISNDSCSNTIAKYAIIIAIIGFIIIFLINMRDCTGGSFEPRHT